MLNEKIYKIEKIILNSKLGNKEDFNHFRFLINPIIKDIFEVLVREIPEIEYRRMEIDQNLYIAIWSELNNYNFDQNCLFYYKLKEKIIDTILDFLNTETSIPKNKIPKKEKIKELIVRKENKKSKKIFYSLKNLTVKQLQVVDFNVYNGITRDKISLMINVSERKIANRFQLAFRKIKKIIYGKKSSAKRKKMFKERSFRLPD
jgi:hypothetical protein